MASFLTTPKNGTPNGLDETHVFTIEFQGGTDLTPFQGRLFHIGGRTLIDYDVNRSAIHLRGGEVLNIRLVEYPANVAPFFIPENHLFFTEENTGLIDSRQIPRTLQISFLASYEGDFSLDLGIPDSPFYDYRNSIGLWIFEVTIT